jgi:hypothetical protein
MFIQSTNTNSFTKTPKLSALPSEGKLNALLSILPRGVVCHAHPIPESGILENSSNSPCFPKLLFIWVRYLRIATDVTALSRRKSQSPSPVLRTRSEFPLSSPANRSDKSFHPAKFSNLHRLITRRTNCVCQGHCWFVRGLARLGYLVKQCPISSCGEIVEITVVLWVVF